MISGGWHGFNIMGVFAAMGELFREVKNSPRIDQTKLQEIWKKHGHEIEEEMITAAATDRQITSVPSENAASAANKVASASVSLSPLTKDEAQEILQEKIENLDIELDALSLLADRFLERAGTPDAYSNTQINSIRKSFTDSIYKCQQANYLAIEHGLSAEIKGTETLEGHFSRILALIPEPPQVAVKEDPFKTQLTELWHRLDSYYNQTMKGLGSVGVMQRRLDEAEGMMAKAVPGEEKEQQKEKLAEAHKLIANIKTELLKFGDEFEELSRMAGPWAVDHLNDQIDITLNDGESLRGRYAMQADSIKDLEIPSTQLRQHYNDYAKNAVQLLERQEKALDNALELKNILKEYKELNTTFSKQLDAIDSMVQEIHDKEDAAIRTAEAKKRFQDVETKQIRTGFVRGKAQDENLIKHIKKKGETPSIPVEGLRRRSPSADSPTEVSEATTPTAAARGKMGVLLNELQGRLDKIKESEAHPVTQVSIEERISRRKELVAKLKAKQGSEPAVKDEELKVFREQVADATKARKAARKSK